MGDQQGATLAALLRSFRLSAGLAQEELAARAGLSAKAISALERGVRRMPYRTTIALLADALALNASDRELLKQSAVRQRAPRGSTEFENLRRDATASDGLSGTPKHNLPLQLTSFVGREREVGDVVTLLADHRLVTLVGSGGIGKTRAALDVGALSLGRASDGVWFAELAPLTDGALIARTIAAAVQLPLPAEGERVAALAAALRRLHVLIVLDNCEHLIGATAHLVSVLLHGCPRVTVLATSREALGIAGEAAYRLPSLSVPPTSEPARMNAAAARRYPAVDLFTSRAGDVDSSFELRDDNALAVVNICRRLDGIPLAIELAAATVRVLGPDQLERLLDERFRVLTGGPRDALPRHRTMRATIDWSYDLLSDSERALLRRVSVFAGGWTLEAAESVCGDAPLQERDIFDLHSSLIDKSLVVADITAGDARYRLLESTHAYAAEKLVDAGERGVVARRHAEWVAAFACVAYGRNWALPVARWLPTVEIELDNVRTALHWALNQGGDVALGGDIVGNLIGLWFFYREGRDWAEAALRAIGENGDRGSVARLCSTLALLTAGQRSVEAAERAVALNETLSDPFEIAWSHRQLAMSQLQAGSSRAALASIERAIALFRETGMTRTWPYPVAMALRAAALTSLERHDEARVAFSEAIALLEKLGDERRADMHRVNLAKLECLSGNPRAALALVITAAESFLQTNDIGRAALARCSAAAYQLLLGEIGEAAAEAHSALQLALRAQMATGIATAIQHIATAAALRGAADSAAGLCGYLDAWYRTRGHARDATELRTYDMLLAALREHLAEDELTKLTMEGARLQECDAIREALALYATESRA